jgi:sirohydrochlorin cobaltochelatase
MQKLANALHDWLEGGGRWIGEIEMQRHGSGFRLTHRDDRARPDLVTHTGPEAARELAHYDDAGKFRPLKTAPNLRHGWRLSVADLAELRRALDYFYPAMLGVWLSHCRGELHPVPLRDTLARQTGMYRVTQKITDEQAQAMIGAHCRLDGGCLKRILWPLAPGLPVTSLPAEKFDPAAPPGSLPLLCHEACNLLVAKAREVVKKAASPS